MKKFLIGLFAVILPSMMAISFIASLERSVFQAGRGLWLDRWFRATLLDACFGFIIFYVWVAYKEKSTASRIVSFILIMALRNVAAAFSVLLQLRKLRTIEPREKLLLREET